MIEKIIPDRISLTLPTVFGEELTFLEFCGKLRAKLNESIDVVNKNTSDIEDVASKTNENTTNINTLSGKVDKNTTDIQHNTADIRLNGSRISKNTTDIEKNTAAISKNTTDIQKNTSDIQQNTLTISGDAEKIAALTTAFNALRSDFLNKKVESLFAPVILNVENHEFGADINFSVYVRLGRIDWQGLGCLYAKVNLSFSGAAAAKALKINSVQFGDRKAADINSVSTSFTAKTDVINLPISFVGTADIPVGTSDISVTGINLLGVSIVASSLDSSFALDSIPTGTDIPCESLAFTSPAGGEEDSKIVYTFKASEGCFDIFTTSAGVPAMSERASLQTDFTSIISNQKVFSQFLCNGGAYNSNTISTVANNGASLGAALINYTEFNGDGGHVYTARATLRTINAAGSNNILKNTGIASQLVPYGEFAHISLTFDMFN